MKTLRQSLGIPVLWHRVGWHGKSTSPNLAGYDSRDPKVITHQLQAMLDLGGDGAGVIHLHYGLNSPFINESALETCNQANVLGMPFALCMDPWSVKDANGNLLPSPAKEAAPEHPEHAALFPHQLEASLARPIQVDGGTKPDTHRNRQERAGRCRLGHPGSAHSTCRSCGSVAESPAAFFQ
jgi:hypothetical protein